MTALGTKMSWLVFLATNKTGLYLQRVHIMAASVSMSTRTHYAEPKTFMEALLECSAFIDKLRKDPAYTKEDVLDSMETRMSFLVGKMATSPTCMPFKIFPDPAES